MITVYLCPFLVFAHGENGASLAGWQLRAFIPLRRHVKINLKCNDWVKSYSSAIRSARLLRCLDVSCLCPLLCY